MSTYVQQAESVVRARRLIEMVMLSACDPDNSASLEVMSIDIHRLREVEAVLTGLYKSSTEVEP